jgi:precorrin-2 dehydrogenase/sirohydrochlorin ferrochelatase
MDKKQQKENPNERKGSLLLAWQVTNKHCLVIGAGDVALSRIDHLITAKAKITVITGSATVHPKIKQYYEEGLVQTLIERDYKSSDLTMY